MSTNPTKFSPLDHSRGHDPASANDFLAPWYAKNIHHNACGGRIRRDDFGPWHCARCQAAWQHRVIVRFSDDAIATRFHIRGRVETSAGLVTLVWKTEGANRFLTVVPAYQAEEFERFTF